MNQTTDYPTVRYMNKFLKTAAEIPKEDYDADGNITLECRKLHKLFMGEPDDEKALEYRNRVVELSDQHFGVANELKKTDMQGYAREMQRHFYALHCLEQMKI